MAAATSIVWKSCGHWTTRGTVLEADAVSSSQLHGCWVRETGRSVRRDLDMDIKAHWSDVFVDIAALYPKTTGQCLGFWAQERLPNPSRKEQMSQLSREFVSPCSCLPSAQRTRIWQSQLSSVDPSPNSQSQSSMP